VELLFVNALSSNATTRSNWWKEKEKTLKSSRVGDITIDLASCSVKDENGTAVDLSTYAYELVDGQMPVWSGKLTKKATAYALAKFTVYSDDTKKTIIQQNREKEITVSITLTNAIPDHDNKATFSTIESYEEAEEIPAGLAQSIYDSRSTLQHDGNINLFGAEVAGPYMGKSVSITGLDITLQGLMVQGTVERPHYGEIMLTLGAPEQVGVTDLIELLRVNRYRRIFTSPASRLSAIPSSGSNVTLGENVGKENTTGNTVCTESAHASAIDTSDSTVALAGCKSRDTGGNVDPALVVQKHTASSGAVDATKGQIELLLSRAFSKVIKLREAKVCLADGTANYCLVLASEPYATKLIPAETAIGDTPPA
jgi:hypothetical protein